jgi:parallel beta-helix repeat protein
MGQRKLFQQWLGGLVALVLVCLPGPAAHAAPLTSTCTSVGGAITATTTWTTAMSPLCVTSSVDIAPDATLTIQPGVTITFSSGEYLQVDGTLVAQGTAARPITFTSASATPQPGDWDYIYFSPTAVSATFSNGTYVSGSVLRYATIQFAGASQTVGITSSGAIQATASVPDLDHLSVRANLGDGIFIEGSSSAFVTNSFIDGNGGDGVSFSYLHGSATVSGNTLTNNTGSGAAFNNAVGTVTGNTISGNGYSGIWGNVYPQGMNITGNRISNQGSTGIAVNANFETVNISGNTLNGNSGGGLWAWEMMGTITGNTITGNTAPDGAGIYANHGGPTISGNTISGNTATGQGGGIYVFADVNPVSNNTISHNTASAGGGIYLDYNSSIVVAGNVIVDNTATSATGGGGVNMGGYSYPTINGNDIHGNTTLVNQLTSQNDLSTLDPTRNAIDAQNNWWGTTSAATIDQTIWDYHDDLVLAIVNYATVLTGSIALPDLVVAVQSTPPTSVRVGASFPVTTTVSNRRSGNASASTVGYYLTAFSSSPSTIKLTGIQPVVNLSPGTSISGSTRVTVPSATVPGTYYVVACANDNHLVVESNQRNDCLTSPVPIQITGP